MRRVVISFVGAAVLVLGSTVLATTLSSVADASTTVLPKVVGSFGTTPTITFPSVAAPKTLETTVLHRGSGPIVKKGTLLVANYLGQIWRGKVFDSSFSRHETAAFPIGVGAVIPGWDDALPDLPLGSRVLIVIPPTDGYGASGESAAGIGPNTTLVFVVDLIATYGASVGLHFPATVVASGTQGITVKNPLGTSPAVHIASSLAKPTVEHVTLLARGNGRKVTPGMLILQFLAESWTNSVVGSTWQEGLPEGEYAGSKTTPGPFDALVGMSIGSRVLIELPESSQGGPYAIALEIAGEAPTGNASS